MAIYSLKDDTLWLDEQVIYGSSRLGVVKQEKVLWTKNTSGISNIGPAPVGISIAGTHINPAALTFLQPKIKYNRVLGKKRYELTNHLGNVMVVVSDKKIANDQNNDGIIDYYTADVKATYDYYAGGGQLMPGRNFNADQYRFKYQGQESTDEVYGVGNLYSFEFRESNSRTGGDFWSVDPLFRDYPGWSPYAFSQRRYNDGTELEGLEWEPLNEKGNPVAPGSENIADYRWVGWSKVKYATTENDMTKVSDEPLSDKSVPFGVEAPAGTVPSAELQMTDRTKVIYSSDPFKMTGQTLTVQTTTIRVNRYYEDTRQTRSTFEISGTDIKGIFIEPPGPSTIVSGQNRRIPANTYGVYKHWRQWHEGWYGLVNADVAQRRRILMHQGDDYTWTVGCLVCNDRETVWDINNQIRNVGVKNTRVIINENIQE